MDKVVFPTWDEFSSKNKIFIDNDKYEGFSLKYHICENLYLILECRNEDCVLHNNRNLIHVMFGTPNGFSIAGKDYKFCLDGYYTAIYDALHWAKEFSNAFSSFRDTCCLGTTSLPALDVYKERFPEI